MRGFRIKLKMNLDFDSFNPFKHGSLGHSDRDSFSSPTAFPESPFVLVPPTYKGQALRDPASFVSIILVIFFGRWIKSGRWWLIKAKFSNLIMGSRLHLLNGIFLNELGHNKTLEMETTTVYILLGIYFFFWRSWIFCY